MPLLHSIPHSLLTSHSSTFLPLCLRKTGLDYIPYFTTTESPDPPTWNCPFALLVFTVLKCSPRRSLFSPASYLAKPHTVVTNAKWRPTFLPYAFVDVHKLDAPSLTTSCPLQSNVHLLVFQLVCTSSSASSIAASSVTRPTDWISLWPKSIKPPCIPQHNPTGSRLPFRPAVLTLKYPPAYRTHFRTSPFPSHVSLFTYQHTCSRPKIGFVYNVTLYVDRRPFVGMLVSHQVTSKPLMTASRFWRLTERKASSRQLNRLYSNAQKKQVVCETSDTCKSGLQMRLRVHSCVPPPGVAQTH